VGDLRHQIVEELAQDFSDDAGESVQLASLDLIDRDPEPGCSIHTGLDVHPGTDIEAELPPAFGRLSAPGDSVRNRTAHRGMELTLDLTRDQQLPRARLDRGEAEAVYGPAILPGLLERDGR